MRRPSSQHRHIRASGFFGRIGHFFRERQIYVRSRGEIQFVTMRPYMMVIGLFILMSGFFWIAYASINVTFKDELIAVKERNLYQTRLNHEERISDLRKTIDGLNQKLMLDQDGYLQEVDKLRGEYKNLVGQHQRLTEFFRQGWLPVQSRKVSNPFKDRSSLTPEKSDKQNPFPNSTDGNEIGSSKIDNNKIGKGSFNQLSMGQKYAAQFTNRKQVLAPLGDVRLEMAAFSALQAKLLDEVISFARAETSKTVKIYTALGVNPDKVLKSADFSRANSVGGPFVAITANYGLAKNVAVRMRKAVTYLNRAKLLQKQARQLPLAMPVGNISRFTSKFGLRSDPYRKVAAMHTGIDIKAPYAAKVRATAGGVVLSAGWAGGYGRLIKVQHKNGIITKYAHLSKILVKTGQPVKVGLAIGLLGNSGRSTGAHLHYETRLYGRALNPTRFWKARYDFQKLSKKK